MSLKKVLFLDRWAKGPIHTHFIPILKELELHEIGGFMVHFGSKFDEEAINATFPNLKVKDISSYRFSMQNAKSIIDETKPDIIIYSGLINQPITQAFLHAAKVCGVKMGWIQYGSFMIRRGDENKLFNKKINFSAALRNLSFSFIFLIKTLIKIRAFKELIRCLYKYARALLIHKSDYARTKLDFTLIPDFAIVNDNLTKKTLLKNYSISKVHVCGNPFIEIEKRNVNSQKQDPITSKKAVFILQQLFEMGMVESFEWLFSEYKRLYEQLSDLGYDVTYKLHPSNSSDLESRLNELEGLTVVRNCDLNTLIDESDVVLGIASTVIITAVYLGKKTIITKWIAPNFVDQTGINDYKAVTIVDGLEQIVTALDSSNDTLDDEAYEHFINDLVGPAIGRKAIKNMSDGIFEELKTT